MMFRKTAIYGLVALSIAAAPVAAPAAMAKDNVDRLLMGLVAIGIAGAIAHEVNDNKRKKTAHRQPVYDPHTEDFKPRKRQTRRYEHRHGNRVHSHKYHRQHSHNRRVDEFRPRPRDRDDVGVTVHKRQKHQKPRTCLRQRWTQNGWAKFYSKRCLQQHGY